MIKSIIDQLRWSDEIRKHLKSKYNYSDYEIRDRIGITGIPGSTTLHILYRGKEKTEELFKVTLQGEII